MQHGVRASQQLVPPDPRDPPISLLHAIQPCLPNLIKSTKICSQATTLIGRQASHHHKCASSMSHTAVSASGIPSYIPSDQYMRHANRHFICGERVSALVPVPGRERTKLTPLVDRPSRGRSRVTWSEHCLCPSRHQGPRGGLGAWKTQEGAAYT